MKYKFQHKICALTCAMMIAVSAVGCRKVEEPPATKSDIDSTSFTETEISEYESAEDEATAKDTENEETDSSFGESTAEAYTNNSSETGTDTAFSSSSGTTAVTKPNEPSDTNRFLNVPDALKAHPLIQSKEVGECAELKGNILITFVFLDDVESSWNDSARSSAKSELNSEISKLKSLASSYGVSLNISTDYKNGTAKNNNMGDGSPFYTWVHGAISSAGLSSLVDLNSDIIKANSGKKIDEAPVIFLVNKTGRSYAESESTENDAGEYAVIFNNEYYDEFSHELLHLFGAEDYYYPASVKTAATNCSSKSIMITSSEKTVDPLTAFLVGWTDTLNSAATNFLNATSSLTEDELTKARIAEQFTGNGTKTTSYGTYTGDMVRGIFEGYGRYVLNDGRIYEGYWTNGELNGYGKCISAEGDMYEGDWVNFEKHGEGVLTWADGDVYEGHFEHDHKSGQGTYTWPNGNKYVGEWANGNRNGQGTFTTPDGYKYEGSWVNSLRSGKGTCTFSDGAKYEGDWANDVRHGQGIYTWNNGDKYEGSFENDVKSGYGIFTKADGSVYKGNWQNGQRSGQGSMTWARGSSYTGEWANDALNGYGTYTWADGTVYTGYWKDNLMHGEGTMTYPNGTAKSGTWENDKFIG